MNYETSDEEFVDEMTEIADRLVQGEYEETNIPNEDFNRLWRLAGLIVNNRKEGDFAYVSVPDFKRLVIQAMLDVLKEKNPARGRAA
jgi:hypothetical protein